MNELKIILENISIWVIILPLIGGSWLIKKMSRDSLIIFFLVIVATPPQLCTAFFSLNTSALNTLYNIYTPCEFLILFYLFKNKFLSQRNFNFFKATVVVYILASIACLYFFDLKTKFINQWACINNVIYSIWVLMYISEIFFFTDTKVGKSSPFTYYLLGIFFYAQSTILVFALYYYIIKDSILGNTWIIQSLSNIMMYVFFTIGFIVDAKKKAIVFSKKS